MQVGQPVFSREGKTVEGHGRDRSLFVCVAAAVLFITGVAPCHTASAGIVYWNMETAAATSNDVFGLAISHVSRGNAANTTLLTGTSSSTDYSFLLGGTSLNASSGSNAGAAARGGSLDTGTSSHFTVTLTNTASYALTLEAFGFGSRSTPSGPLAFSLRTSLDGYGRDLAGGTGSLMNDSTWRYHTLSLTVPLAIASETSVSVRLYGSDGSATSAVTSVNWRIDDLQITVVPEPSASTMAATILVVFFGGHWLAMMRTRPASRPVRAAPTNARGFSLVELLVSIAIIGLLVGLVLPAAQAAREAARRTTCASNVRQIAMALMAHESLHSHLPAATRSSERKPDCQGCYDPWREARLSGVTAGSGKHGTSWMLAILPLVEQMTVFAAWNHDTNVLGNASPAQTDIPLFYCPSRRQGIRTGRDDHRSLVSQTWRGGGTDYGGCMGRVDGFVNDAGENTDWSGRHRYCEHNDPADPGPPAPWSIGGVPNGHATVDGLFRTVHPRRVAAVRDGLSQTFLVGELQRLRPSGLSGAANTDNRTSYDGWAVGGAATLFVTATDPTRGNPGGMNNGFFESPGSDHVGGATFAMADGSVRFVGEFVDARDNDAVFPRLGAMRDGQPVFLGQ